MESELFNPRIDEYVINIKGVIHQGGGLDAEIQKINGTKIGKIKAIGTFYKKTLMSDIDDSVVLTAKKNTALRTTYTIKDSDGNEIGTAKTIGVFKTKFIMVNPKGDKILTKVDSNRLVGDNEINSADGKNVTKFIVKSTAKNPSFLRPDGDYFTCNLKINESDFDRKLMWGFFISYISKFFDTSPSG